MGSNESSIVREKEEFQRRKDTITETRANIKQEQEKIKDKREVLSRKVENIDEAAHLGFALHALGNYKQKIDSLEVQVEALTRKTYTSLCIFTVSLVSAHEICQQIYRTHTKQISLCYLIQSF